MNILLIYPYFLEQRIHVEEIAAVPMGLYYVGAMLKSHGHKVEILNWYDMGGNPEAIKEVLMARDPQVIGFSIVHANRWGAIEIARLAKELNPKVCTVFGGIGATFLWHHLLTHFTQIDYVMVGEGEVAFLELVRALEQKAGPDDLARLPGLALRYHQEPVQPVTNPPIKDLDRLPPPARYFDFQHIALTRGCPGRCTFCGSPRFWGRQVRAHSADYFVGQIEMLAARGISYFYVSDDTFTLDAGRVIAVCRKIIERKLDITWQAISKVNAVNADMLAWMRKAGCVQISYGVESGSSEIRKRLCKDIREDQIQRAFRLTTAHGILPRAYFIYGAPGENDRTVDASIGLIDRIRPLSAIFYILDIFPGTALYDDFKRQNTVDDDIWLDRKEDILYFENDPELSADDIRAYGQRLRSGFAQRLPRFALEIELAEDPSLAREQADFLSRLGLTFSHGDYAGIDAQPPPLEVAVRLFQRALALYPDHRAYWGAAMAYGRLGDHSQARAMAREGLDHFPESPELNICMGAILLEYGEIKAALGHLEPHEDQPQAWTLLARCYHALGDSRNADRYTDRLTAD